MKFIHTSDWQVGKVFRMVDEETMAVLQSERVEVISRIGRLAVDRGVPIILVAGDVYDTESPTDQTLEKPIERMRAFPSVEWHLIPGNHDSHRPNGLWDRLLRKGLPSNVKAHLEPGLTVIGDGSAVLLPAPLTRRHALGDLTEYMDTMASPDQSIRIGLAHGSITEFGSDGTTTHNRIDPARVDKANLAYLALGDWHGQVRVTDRIWYSGTPEPDGFKEDAEGLALLVEIDGPKALPNVTPLKTGRFRWVQLDESINSEDDVTVLDQRVRRLDEDLSRLLIQLRIEGALSLAERANFQARVETSLGAAIRYLRLDDTRLGLKPTVEDLDAIDHAGFLRVAAERLKAKAENEVDPDRHVAALALQRLYVLHRRSQEQ